MIDVPVLVKDALREGSYRKNYRFIVLDDGGDEDFTIDNNNLVAESVMIDERLCSGDELKFGLCEGSSLEFQYFGYPLITGRQIQAFIDVEYVSERGLLTWFPIPMGFFTADKCSRQASTGIIKVTAYNKLMSDYLDAKANRDIVEIATEGIAGAPQTVNIGLILDSLLGGYAIKRKEFVSEGTFSLFTIPNPTTGTQFVSRGDYQPLGQYLHVLNPAYRFYPTDYSTDNVYRMVMNCKAIYNATKPYLQELSNFYLNEVELERRSGGYDTLANQFEYGEQGAIAFLVAGVSPYYKQITVRNNEHDELDRYETEWGTNIRNNGFEFQCPVLYKVTNSATNTWTQEELNLARQRITQIISNNWWFYEESAQSDLEKIKITLADAESMADVTMRDLQSAVFESQCQFGQLDRETDLFSGVELNQSKLYPQDILYPATNLYPGGSHLSGFKSMYSKLWADEGNVHKWRYLIITYKGLNSQDEEVERRLQRTVFEDGTDNYNCSDNWLFRNLVWEAEDIAEFADAMVEKMREISWFPFEMWAAGLPYVETGDEIEITVGENTYTSYILQRSLNGIQNLQDTYINGTLDIF